MIESHEPYELPPRAAAALAHVIARDAALAVDSLRDAAIREPVAAICLYIDEPESVELPDLVVTRERDRARRRVDSWEDHWIPDEDEDVYVEVPVLDDEEFADAEAKLLEALEGRVLDPLRWVLLRVARELNHRQLPVPLADDAIVHLLDHDPGDDLIDELRFVAPPGVFERLCERGLIGRPEEG